MVLDSGLWNRTFAFLFRLVDVLFTVFTHKRVQQRSRSSSLILEFFKVFTRDRVVHSVVPGKTLTSLFRGPKLVVELLFPGGGSSSRRG